MLRIYAIDLLREKDAIDQVFIYNKLGPLDLWKMDIADLQSDTEIQYTSMCIEARSEKSRIPCSD